MKKFIILFIAIFIIATKDVQATPIGWSVDTTTGHAVVTTTLGETWLSPTATLGFTTTEALTANDGYQLATVAQWDSLIIGYDLTNTRDFEWYDSGENAAAASFIFDFRPTFSNEYQEWIWGWLATDPDSGVHFTGMVNRTETISGIYPETLISTLDHHGSGGALARSNRGFWLVRDTNPVPEPTTIALLGIGLVGLAGAEVRRRRKREKAKSIIN